MVMTVIGLLAGPMAADAVPITYTFYDVSLPGGGQVAGSLGDLTFSGPNYELIFTFTGDTSNVVPWSVPLARGGFQKGVRDIGGDCIGHAEVRQPGRGSGNVSVVGWNVRKCRQYGR